jgi:hypothetical protein
MCQALGQRSFRAIIKLEFLLFFYMINSTFNTTFSTVKNLFTTTIIFLLLIFCIVGLI